MVKGSDNLTFTYNDAGLRTGKTGHTYYYQGDLLTADVTSTDALYFHYDQNGSIIGFSYKSGSTTTEYYYLKNLQGDVIGIIDANGSLVGSYTYNAWGQVISSTDNTVTNRNPIRYRGYYYDTESGLYYLQSRYYNPEIGRFISADGYAATGDGILCYNMFAYSSNNPIMNVDPDGDLPYPGLVHNKVVRHIAEKHTLESEQKKLVF